MTRTKQNETKRNEKKKRSIVCKGYSLCYCLFSFMYYCKGRKRRLKIKKYED